MRALRSVVVHDRGAVRLRWVPRVNLFSDPGIAPPPQAGRYAVLYIDDPWPEKGGGKIKRGADKHYDLMSVDAIAALPFGEWAAPNAHCYMWATNNYLEDAFRIMRLRGFRYVTTCSWVKANSINVDACGVCFSYAQQAVSVLQKEVSDKGPQAEILQRKLQRESEDQTYRDRFANSQAARPTRLELQRWIFDLCERLQDSTSTGSSDGPEAERTRPGASFCDGEKTGSNVDEGRIGSSYQRRQIRQSSGKPDDHDAEGSFEGAASRDVSGVRTCVLCGRRPSTARAIKFVIGLGQYYRGATEHCLFGVRGRLPYRIKPSGKRAQGETVLYAPESNDADPTPPADLPDAFEAPRREHSRKPEEMRAFIEVVSAGPRLEIFARRPSLGWDVWGNEC